MAKQDDLELLQFMKEAALEKCESSIEKWQTGIYSNDRAMIHENVGIWKDKIQKITDLYELLKKQA